jgi:hypothetical protein
MPQFGHLGPEDFFMRFGVQSHVTPCKIRFVLGGSELLLSCPGDNPHSYVIFSDVCHDDDDNNDNNNTKLNNTIPPSTLHSF